MKRVIKYLMAILLTAWTGALTLFIGFGAVIWIAGLAMKVAESGALAIVALVAAMVVMTALAADAVKSLVRKWDNKKD